MSGRCVGRCAVAAAAWLAAAPLVAAYRMLAAGFGPNRAFPGFSQAVALVPGTTGVYLRQAFYRATLAECGAGAYIGFGVLVSHPAARIGAGVYVGPYGVLGRVTLRDDTLVGSHVSVTNGGRQHGTERLDVPMRDQPGEWPDVTLGPDAWVGDRAVVMADVGPHAVVGAGAVVTRPVAAYGVAAGVPARVLRYRSTVAAPETVADTASASTP